MGKGTDGQNYFLQKYHPRVKTPPPAKFPCFRSRPQSC